MIKKSQTQLATDVLWKTLLRSDPNLNQYDALNAPLFAATMINILRPVITVQKAQGALFSQSGFMKDFPSYDRTKLDNVFGEGGNVQYSMNGKFLAAQPQISVFAHINHATRLPCMWNGTANQRMTISTCRVKGMCKGKDVPNPWSNKAGKNKTNQQPSGQSERSQAQKNQPTEGSRIDEDSTTRTHRQVLSKPFVFENEEDDELAYSEALERMQGVVLCKTGAKPSSWLEGTLLGCILDVLDKCPDKNRVLKIVRKTLAESSRWSYVCKILDLLDTVYSPREFFLPGNDQGLAVFKYLLVYLVVCHSFHVETFHSKPTYTACGFLGSCTKAGREMNYVLNYDMLFAQDAPYVTTPMDYTLYGNSMHDKVYGGPCMTKVAVTQSGILRSMPAVFSSKFSAPYFILMTPCVPFPAKNGEDKSLELLSALSFEEILSRLHFEKMANLVARACGYDNLRCAASLEADELAAKLSCLSISTRQAEIIAKLLQDMVATTVKESTAEDDALMTWEDDYELSEECTSDEPHHSDGHVEDLINMYQ